VFWQKPNPENHLNALNIKALMRTISRPHDSRKHADHSPTKEISMNKLLLTLLASALTISLPAFADHDGMGDHCQMHTHKTFEEADTDKDGTLDKEEAKALGVEDFDKMDTDHDGTLSKDELKACACHKHHKSASAAHQKHSREFAAADTDHDGTLTKEEAKKLPHVYENFDAIDTDHDGTVSREEVHTFMHQQHSK
jgi:Ca2+-binding EF-hand superfamily protein